MATWDESKYERDQSGRFKTKYTGQAGRNHRIRAAEASKYILEGGTRPDWVKAAPEKGGRGGSSRSKGSSKGGGGSSRGGGKTDPYAAIDAERDARLAREAEQDAASAAEQAKFAKEHAAEVMALMEQGMGPEEAEALVAEKARYRARVHRTRTEARRKAREAARQAETAEREAIRRRQG